MPQGESAPRTFVLYQRVVGTEYPMMRVSTRTILCPHVERFGLPPPRERPVKVVDGDGTVRPASNAELRAMEERDGARPAPVTHAHWYQVAARELDERWGR